MQQLPFDILENIFSSLNKKDWVQCQLTSKLWYQASIKLLYTEIDINHGIYNKPCFCVVRNKPEIGQYVKSINLKKGWNDSIVEEIRTTELLNFLFKHCPNVVAIHEETHSPTLIWTYFNDVSDIDRFPLLQVLPYPHCQIEKYLDAVVLFKKSLTILNLNSIKYIFECHPKIYQKFSAHINEFENLKYLNIDFKNNEVDYCETILEDFKNIKSLCIKLTLKLSEVPILEQVESIVPDHSIKILELEWEAVEKNCHLEYIMKKYSSLQSITVTPDCEEYTRKNPVSFHVMAQFLQYISKIPKTNIDFVVPQNIWIRYLKSSDYKKDIVFKYAYSVDNSSNFGVKIKNGLTTVRYICGEKFNNTSHIKFILDAGKFIRSIDLDVCSIVSRMSSSSEYNAPRKKRVNVFQIVKSCPLLEELMVNDLSLECSTKEPIFQHTALKYISIATFYPENKLKFFQAPYLDLPNLKTIHINENSRYRRYQKYEYRTIVEINLKNLNLDLLTWHSNFSYLENQYKDSYYVTINNGEELFVGRNGELLPKDRVYNRQLKKYCHVNFYITGPNPPTFKVVSERKK